MHRLRTWGPPVAWMGVVMYLSGGSWSAAETGTLLGALLGWLLPTATPAQLAALHAAARKAAHLTEYAILALLWRRALIESGRARLATWLPLVIGAAWALIDEAHQATIPSRTGSAVDVVIDTIGAATALVVARRDWRAIVDRTTAVVLWTAVVGGLAALAINAWAGVESVALCISTPAAALLLAWHRRSRRRL